jgi:hypothetical protein
MKRLLIIIAGSILLAFIVIQFFRPEKNQSAVTTDDIIYTLEIPNSVKRTLVNACYDCHSNQTRYPWYSNIAPVSWMLANHVKEGKEHLNFSAWKQYSKREQISQLDDICEMVEKREMPLKSYTFMHSEAIILEYQVKELCTWTEAAARSIMTGN